METGTAERCMDSECASVFHSADLFPDLNCISFGFSERFFHFILFFKVKLRVATRGIKFVVLPFSSRRVLFCCLVPTGRDLKSRQLYKANDVTAFHVSLRVQPRRCSAARGHSAPSASLTVAKSQDEHMVCIRSTSHSVSHLLVHHCCIFS